MTPGNRSIWIAAAAVVVVALVFAGGFLVGSATDDAAPASPSPSPTSSGVPTTSPSPSEEPTQAPAPEIEDGRHFAFLSEISTGGTRTITFDLAYFLTGEEAAQAAADHGDESPPPNDYYIVNDNPKLRTVPVADDAVLRILDWQHCCDAFLTGSLDEMADAMATGADPYGTYRYTSPFWLTVEGGEIVLIEEQYLP